MRVTADILYGLLSERYQINRYGKGIAAKELALPMLYEAGTQAVPGGVYIARTGDLPNRPPEGCVIICCGTKPPKVWNMWPCDVMHVADPRVSIMAVFNSTLSILDAIVTWESRMQRLAISGAHVRELIEESIPIFENSITVSDYDLRILGHCEPDDSQPGRPVAMSEKYDLVPTSYISATRNFSVELVRNRKPYTIEENEDPDEGIEGVNSFCINLFQGDSYIGTCALKEEAHPLRSYDGDLFQLFAEYVHDALGVQSQSIGNQLVSARTIFEQILRGYPVSMHDMSQVLKLIESGLKGVSLSGCRWCCAVIQSAHRSHGLPESYLCNTVMSLVPNSTAFMYDNSIVVFAVIPPDAHRVDEICIPLEAYLADMGFVAGVSRTFRDPFHAKTFYNQAINAIEMGFELEPDGLWHLFGNHVLDYMLQNCCGAFGPEAIVAPELVRLWHSGQSGPEYVRTLKAFLDKGCHTTQTAEELYLHRSTLIKRLERIREMVDLSSDDRRLYLQMCLHLPDIEQILEVDTDVCAPG